MDSAARGKRESAIFNAAYDILSQHGYGGASMLRIAKAAKASNETLYRWYGDKDSLFKAMVRQNAIETRILLEDALRDGDDPWGTLEKVAPVFLEMILSDRAILLNRAAGSDATGLLGAAISAGGRDEIMPLIQRLMSRLSTGTTTSAEQAADWFISLLVGDLQIKRFIHQSEALTKEQTDARCRMTISIMRRLMD